MSVNRIMMDAITLVAASQAKDTELSEGVLSRHDDHRELLLKTADVAALLSGTGATKNSILGYLELVGASSSNGKR